MRAQSHDESLRSLRLALATVIGLLSPSLGSQGATITWEFEAIVRGTAGTPPASSSPYDAILLAEGQVLRGSLSFDSSTPDTATGSAFVGSYPGAVTSIVIEYLTYFEPDPPGPYFLTLSATPGASRVIVADGAPDVILLSSDLQFESLFPYHPTSIRALQIDLTAAAGPGFLTGDDLLLAPPALSDLLAFDPSWPSASLRTGLFLSSADDGFRVGAEFTMLRAVPEPCVLAPFAVALLALARGVSARRSS